MGIQNELPEDWLTVGNPWEFQRPDVTYVVGFGGAVTMQQSVLGKQTFGWAPAETILAAAYDTPVIGGDTGGEEPDAACEHAAPVGGPCGLASASR